MSAAKRSRCIRAPTVRSRDRFSCLGGSLRCEDRRPGATGGGGVPRWTASMSGPAARTRAQEDRALGVNSRFPCKAAVLECRRDFTSWAIPRDCFFARVHAEVGHQRWEGSAQRSGASLLLLQAVLAETSSLPARGEDDEGQAGPGLSKSRQAEVREPGERCPVRRSLLPGGSVGPDARFATRGAPPVVRGALRVR
jgi:hypothetical protein